MTNEIRTIEAQESEDGQVHHMGRCFSIMHETMENDITEVVKNRWGSIHLHHLQKRRTKRLGKQTEKTFPSDESAKDETLARASGIPEISL